ncbi:MAG: heavy metal translocating P-type ATPase [Spirochaetaceae bacterium]|nr:heavy metal translocating P-type ATPase [Spirochaetaceae bacterium]
MSHQCCCCQHDSQTHVNSESHNHGVQEAGESKLIYKLRMAVGFVLFAFGFLVEHGIPPLPQSLLADGKFLFVICAASWLLTGGDVLLQALRNIGKGRFFDENFLMSIATIGAFLIGEYPEAAAVMLFYQIGEAFQSAATGKSRASIAKLMDIRPDFARRLGENGEEEKLDPSLVKIGERIIVRPGEKVPLDGIIEEGDSSLDLSALSGESIPRDVYPGSEALSGAINTQGALIIRVTKSAGESTVAKILRLVEENAEKKSRAENFITKFARYYTPAVVGAAVLLAVLPPVISGSFEFKGWVYKALVFLVVSCPCALVISIPLSFSGGLGAASRQGILVKGSNYLAALANVDTVIFDKTGTLTRGIFRVCNLLPQPNFSDKTLLTYAAGAEAHSNHPVALALKEAAFELDNEGGSLPLRSEADASALSPSPRGAAPKTPPVSAAVSTTTGTQYTEIPGHGVKAVIDGKTILAGNAKFMTRENIEFTSCGIPGTIVYIAADGVFAGAIVVNDEVKPGASRAVNGLCELGVRNVAMFTGDTNSQAKETARIAGISTVYSELLPHEKAEKVELILSSKKGTGNVVFAGDGINDAPALAIADIGVAMGGTGSDAAIEAADLVLMTDEPEKIVSGIRIARRTKRIVTQNITLALGVKAVILALGVFGFAPIWGAVFGDVGVALLAVLNSMRALSAK